MVDNPQTSLLADKATGHSPSYLGVIYWIKSLGGLVSVDNEGNIESVRVGMLHAPESDLLLDRLHTFTKLRSLDLMCCDVTDVSLEKGCSLRSARVYAAWCKERRGNCL